jgi:hypothetical protein
MTPSVETDPITRFIANMKEALREAGARGARLPLERRKLRTILSECGKRASARALTEIEMRLTAEGINTEPKLGDPGLRRDDWVFLSTGPIPPDSALFPREKDLQRFVQACLGSSTFRNLELFKGKEGREYRLPDGRRIDLLCQERTRTGTGALVVIELKREHERGTVEQVMGYIDALSERFPKRTVKAIIVSGREDLVASMRLRQVTGYDIRWLCYHVTFDDVAKSS